MNTKINVDKNNVSEGVNELQKQISSYKKKNLAPIDKKTTLTANVNSQNAYEFCESGFTKFISSLENDKNKMQALYNAFDEFDQKQGQTNRDK